MVLFGLLAPYHSMIIHILPPIVRRTYSLPALKAQIALLRKSVKPIDELVSRCEG